MWEAGNMEMKDTPAYYKASAIAFKLKLIRENLFLTPEDVLRKASISEINFYYERLCKE